MTKKRYPVHYANFVCHFGDLELLDYLKEIVLPAFEPKMAERTFKDGRYFFDNVELVNLAPESAPVEIAICGRIVKDMVVRSEQRWDNDTEQLIPEENKLETAPSAVFVLLLASHKLIYLLETSNAPGLASFRSTAERFLAIARGEYITSVANRAKTDELTAEEQLKYVELDNDQKPKRVTKKRLQELIGVAQLEIVPLSNEESLRHFMKLFKTLQVASLRLVKPNSEVDNDDFIEDFREKSDAVGSKNSTLIYRNPEGLIRNKVVEQLETAAGDANTEIKLVGVDETGRTLRGSNEEFKIVSYLEDKPPEIKTLAKRMFSLFNSLIKDKLIKTTPVDQSVRGTVAGEVLKYGKSDS